MKNREVLVFWAILRIIFGQYFGSIFLTVLNQNTGFHLGAIHKQRLLREGGRGSPLKAHLLHKPI